MIEVTRYLGLPGVNLIEKFGRNPDCDPAASATAVPVGRDVWDGGIAGAAAWVPPTAARVHQLVSSNDEDGGAGTDTGALTCKVFGLDSSYENITESVTLNGTTNVATTNSYIMIHRIEVLTAGSTGRNLGALTATADTDSTVTAKVTADMNQSMMAIYQVPAGKIGVLAYWGADLLSAGGTGKYTDVFLMTKRDSGVWRVRDSSSLGTDGANSVWRETHKGVDTKETVKIVADPSAVAQDVAGGFIIIEYDT